MQVERKVKQRPCGFAQSRYKGETMKDQKLKKYWHTNQAIKDCGTG